MSLLKLQIGCIVVFGYLFFHYLSARKSFKSDNPIFQALLASAAIYLIFDPITVYTVNHLDSVNPALNLFFHAVFLGSLNTFEWLALLYLMQISDCYPSQKNKRVLLWMPFCLNMVAFFSSLGMLYYVENPVSNYSMGVPVYICYVMCICYILISCILFFRRWNDIKSRERISILSYLIFLLVVLVIQSIFPSSLISCIGIVMVFIAIYINIENPFMKSLSQHNEEVLIAMARLVESRDSNTGEHIRRTSLYAELLAKELRREGKYRELLDKDYIENIRRSAPMHDIGKIAVPDAILQKPGQLTKEEYEQIKLHAQVGADLIRDTLKNIGDKDLFQIAYAIARFHHEKWDGTGYPLGYLKDEIPLCARIMAVADVFDAVSQKRCYRDAMPLDECFQIINDGRGTFFEPCIVDAFLTIENEVTKVWRKYIKKEILEENLV